MSKQYMITSEVAKLFGVSKMTVGRWADTDRLSCIRTLGGHRRFLRAEVEDLARRMGALR